MGWNKIGMLGKNSGPVLSRLWTKVHGILGQYRRPFVFPNAFAQLSIPCFIQKIFAIMYRSRRKPNKCKSFWHPIFFRERRPQLFYGRLLARFTIHRLAQFGSVCWSPFVKPGNEGERIIYVGWAKTYVRFQAVCGPKFMSLWDDKPTGDPPGCQRTYRIVYIVFRSEDIGR